MYKTGRDKKNCSYKYSIFYSSSILVNLRQTAMQHMEVNLEAMWQMWKDFTFAILVFHNQLANSLTYKKKLQTES